MSSGGVRTVMSEQAAHPTGSRCQTASDDSNSTTAIQCSHHSGIAPSIKRGSIFRSFRNFRNGDAADRRGFVPIVRIVTASEYASGGAVGPAYEDYGPAFTVR